MVIGIKPEGKKRIENPSGMIPSSAIDHHGPQGITESYEATFHQEAGVAASLSNPSPIRNHQSQRAEAKQGVGRGFKKDGHVKTTFTPLLHNDFSPKNGALPPVIFNCQQIARKVSDLAQRNIYSRTFCVVCSHPKAVLMLFSPDLSTGRADFNPQEFLSLAHRERQ